MPRLISIWPNFASVEVTAMSDASSSSMPMVRQYPRTAITTGFVRTRP
jgi:hypothetical protein